MAERRNLNDLDLLDLKAHQAEIIGTYTVTTLPAASLDMVGKYARVTDLFGEKTDLLLCSNLGTSYYWQPVRTIYAKEMPISTAMTLTPLRSPSVVFITGTATGNSNITLSPTNVWPGCCFEIANEAVLGLSSLNILGLGLGSGLSVLLGARRRLYWTINPSGVGQWRQFT